MSPPSPHEPNLNYREPCEEFVFISEESVVHDESSPKRFEIIYRDVLALLREELAHETDEL